MRMRGASKDSNAPPCLTFCRRKVGKKWFCTEEVVLAPVRNGFVPKKWFLRSTSPGPRRQPASQPACRRMASDDRLMASDDRLDALMRSGRVRRR